MVGPASPSPDCQDGGRVGSLHYVQQDLGAGAPQGVDQGDAVPPGSASTLGALVGFNNPEQCHLDPHPPQCVSLGKVMLLLPAPVTGRTPPARDSSQGCKGRAGRFICGKRTGCWQHRSPQLSSDSSKGGGRGGTPQAQGLASSRCLAAGAWSQGLASARRMGQGQELGQRLGQGQSRFRGRIRARAVSGSGAGAGEGAGAWAGSGTRARA